MISSITRSLTCQPGLIGLIITQKVLKTHNSRVQNITFCVIITPPNRHIASPLAMKEKESTKKKKKKTRSTIYMSTKMMFQNEVIMSNLQQELPKLCPITFLGRVCAMQNQVSKQCQLLENQPDTFHRNLSV